MDVWIVHAFQASQSKSRQKHAYEEQRKGADSVVGGAVLLPPTTVRWPGWPVGAASCHQNLQPSPALFHIPRAFLCA